MKIRLSQVHSRQVQIECLNPRCRHRVVWPVDRLLGPAGDRSLSELERRARCHACGRRGAELRPAVPAGDDGYPP